MADKKEVEQTIPDVPPPAKKKVYASLDEMVSDGATAVEYASCEGFLPNTEIRIGSVSAGVMVRWSEENEDPKKKRVAGLRLICESLVGPEDGDPPNYRYAADPHLIEHNIKKLERMRHKETERVVREILTLNGMTKKQDKDAKND